MREMLTFDDVLLVPRYSSISSRGDVDLRVRSIFPNGLDWLSKPIISANMDTITESEMASGMIAQGGFAILHRFMEDKRILSEYIKSPRSTGISVGIKSSMNMVESLYSAGARTFCVDVAHGHSQHTLDKIKELRDKYQNSICIIAGNVATEQAYIDLRKEGADAIKVGIGPGSACTTRIKTGFGVPQLSAIIDCAKAQDSVGGLLIADGGIRGPGDAVKALAAGADLVMLGGALAGTDEAPGAIREIDGQRYKTFRGMASQEAQKTFFETVEDWKTAEGISTVVPYKGALKDVLKDFCGGIRSGLSYAGVTTISGLQSVAEFIRITGNGVEENRAHIL